MHSCERCGKVTIRKQKDRIFQCKTGVVDQGCKPDIPFEITVKDFEWNECHGCNKAYTCRQALQKLHKERSAAVDRIRNEA